MPRWFWILAAIALLGWWFSPPMHFARAHAPGELAAEAPEQHDLWHAATFRIKDFTITPLADFSVTARVLSRADYRFDRAAALSPTDLALGWERMSDSAVLAKLDIEQSGRWYTYRWSTEGPPIPKPEIIRSSANMHMIPADATVRYELKQVRPGDVVRIDGQLIEARRDDGSIWRSSMTRDDTGDGACEVVYVRSLLVK
ncbi:MAG: hypothetical protein ABIT64_03550 [Lysobacteraceae bacterium]